MGRGTDQVVRVVLIDDGQPHDVFEVVGLADGVLRAKTAFLFEVGEELALRVEDEGKSYDTTGRVRAHVGTGEALVTEVELEPKA